MRALIIVDVQPTFCEGGELGVAGGNKVARKIAQYIKARRGEYAYIATTQDWHIEPGEHFSPNPDFVDTWPVHGVAGSANSALHPEIKALNIEHHFKKGQYAAAYSGFEGVEDNTDGIPSREDVRRLESSGATLLNALRRAHITHVDVCGLALSHCVKETALDAQENGFDTRVLVDLSAPVSPELGKTACEQMGLAGIKLESVQLP